MHRAIFENSCPYDIGDVRSNFIYRDYPEFHDHGYWECLIVFNGQIMHTINNEKSLIKRGDAFLIRPADVHNLVQTGKDIATLNIMVKTEVMENSICNFSPKLFDTLIKKKYIQFSLNEIQMEKIMQYCILLKRDDSVLKDRELVSNMLITNIISNVVEQNTLLVNDKPKWLLNLIDEINKQENLAWSVKDVLNEASYSHSHLTREFKKYLGCTIVEFLTKVKMSAAYDYLIHSDKSIAEIASMLGYESVSHLNHIFKQRTGMSPLKYRKKYRKGVYNE